VDGILKYEDSALVRAVKHGYILVIDEIDKAPTHVTSILKTLADDGDMTLSDGRRIITKQTYTKLIKSYSNPTEEVIVMHDSFRMFLLANKPGFPFLGNDFYKAIGDVFATHCVGHPDFDSEYSLLRNYGNDVPELLLHKLINSFQSLRELVDQGMINYPYSTRELVNVVKHLQEYPEDGLPGALRNVFDFDRDEEVMHILADAMKKNGIPFGANSFNVKLGTFNSFDDKKLYAELDFAKDYVKHVPNVGNLLQRVIFTLK
jgi:hypothetical protein